MIWIRFGFIEIFKQIGKKVAQKLISTQKIIHFLTKIVIKLLRLTICILNDSLYL